MGSGSCLLTPSGSGLLGHFIIQGILDISVEVTIILVYIIKDSLYGI